MGNNRLNFGEYGSLEKDQDTGRVQCHICGHWYRLLGSHVWQMHDLLADEYREEFGLGYMTGLVGEELRQKMVAYAKKEYEAGRRPYIIPIPFTAQRAVKIRGRSQRMELYKKNLAAHQPTIVDQVCIICGKTEPVTLTDLRLTCSDECRLEARRRATARLGSRIARSWWDKFDQLPIDEQKRWLAERALKLRGPQKAIGCSECGNIFMVPMYRKDQKTCSRECHRKRQGRMAKGRKHTPETIAKLSIHAKRRHAIEGSWFGGQQPKGGK